MQSLNVRLPPATFAAGLLTEASEADGEEVALEEDVAVEEEVTLEEEVALEAEVEEVALEAAEEDEEAAIEGAVTEEVAVVDGGRETVPVVITY